MQKMELLAPAGNMDKLKMALLYGADAVYLGGKSFGLRAFSDNFSLEEMEEAVRYAHGLGKKVHVTVNIFPHNADLNGLPEYLTSLRDIHVDAVLIADPGIFSLARQIVPDLPVHISTQANVTNWASAKFWHDAGAKRVVMAREVSLKDVKAIHDKVPVELEGFVHGAMCISYSGRCLLSNYFTETAIPTEASASSAAGLSTTSSKKSGRASISRSWKTNGARISSIPRTCAFCRICPTCTTPACAA